MSALVRRNFDTLKVLRQAKPKLQKAIIANGTNDLVLALAEVVSNVLNGNIKIPEGKRKILSRHKTAIRKIADKKTKVPAKRKLLVQRGGFLATVLPAALSVLASLLLK